MSRGRDPGRGSGRSKDGNRRNSSRSSRLMSMERARAIQSHADKTGRNQDFKSRAMSAASKNESSE